MELAWAETDRRAIRWTRLLVVVALSIAAVALAATYAMDENAVFDLGEIVLGVGGIAGIIVAFGAFVELVFRLVPRAAQAPLLAVTALPLLGVAGALGIPESAIHYSDHVAWAYRAGWEISVVPPFIVAAIAGGIAVLRRQRISVVGAVALVALALSVLGRDIGVRELDPGWCFGDSVTSFGDGAVAGSTHGDCTLLLPNDLSS